MKKNLFLLTFIFIFFGSKAQSDFRAGFIITNTGDTIYGKIDFRKDESNYSTCYFRKDSISNTVKYSPEQLKSYRFLNSKYYISKTVKDNDIIKRLFLECLISGKTSIYYCHLRYPIGNINKDDHYYAEKDSNFVEIYAEKGITDNDGKQFYQITNQYKGALKAFFVDDPKILNEVNKTELNGKSLIRISKKYHEDVCTDSKCIVYEKTAIKRIYQFGLEATYFCSPIDFYENDMTNNHFTTSPKYDMSASIFAATNLDYDYRFMFQVELNYRKQEFQKTQVDVLSNQTIYNYKWSTLTSDFIIKYRLNFLKFKPYAFFGYGIGRVIDDTFNKNEGNLRIGNYTTRYSDLNNNISTNLLSGIGIEYNINRKTNLLFSIKYIRNRISTVDTNGFSFSVGYYFQ